MAGRIPDSSDSAENTRNPDLSDSANESATRLPVFRTWPSLYAFVVATFVLWVTLLAVLARTFS